jgi:mono/diheme cytochrome c family protein
MNYLLATLGVLLLAACSNSEVSNFAEKRPTGAQVEAGRAVYTANCQVCHGAKARGLVRNWRTRGADGALPPPPLNGTAHAWHHDQETLLKTINQGGKPLGGVMPAFKNKLSDEGKIAVLAYIVSLWPEEIYEAWRKRNG